MKDVEAKASADPYLSPDRQRARREAAGLGNGDTRMFIESCEFVSLGCFCAVAHALQALGLKTCTYPFDWNRSPVEGVIQCLQNDFRGFTNCSFSRDEGPKGMLHGGTSWGGSFWHHDVKSSKVQADFARRIERFLGKKDTAPTKPRLFVRAVNSTQEIGASLRLRDALRRAWPKAQIYLLILVDLQRTTGLLRLSAPSTEDVLFARVTDSLFANQARHWTIEKHSVAYTEAIVQAVQVWARGPRALPRVREVRDLQTLASQLDAFDGGNTNDQLFMPRRVAQTSIPPSYLPRPSTPRDPGPGTAKAASAARPTSPVATKPTTSPYAVKPSTSPPAKPLTSQSAKPPTPPSDRRQASQARPDKVSTSTGSFVAKPAQTASSGSFVAKPPKQANPASSVSKPTRSASPSSLATPAVAPHTGGSFVAKPAAQTGGSFVAKPMGVAQTNGSFVAKPSVSWRVASYGRPTTQDARSHPSPASVKRPEPSSAGTPPVRRMVSAPQNSGPTRSPTTPRLPVQSSRAQVANNQHSVRSQPQLSSGQVESEVEASSGKTSQRMTRSRPRETNTSSVRTQAVRRTRSRVQTCPVHHERAAIRRRCPTEPDLSTSRSFTSVGSSPPGGSPKRSPRGTVVHTVRQARMQRYTSRGPLTEKTENSGKSRSLPVLRRTSLNSSLPKPTLTPRGRELRKADGARRGRLDTNSARVLLLPRHHDEFSNGSITPRAVMSQTTSLSPRSYGSTQLPVESSMATTQDAASNSPAASPTSQTASPAPLQRSGSHTQVHERVVVRRNPISSQSLSMLRVPTPTRLDSPCHSEIHVERSLQGSASASRIVGRSLLMPSASTGHMVRVSSQSAVESATLHDQGRTRCYSNTLQLPSVAGSGFLEKSSSNSNLGSASPQVSQGSLRVPSTSPSRVAGSSRLEKNSSFSQLNTYRAPEWPTSASVPLQRSSSWAPASNEVWVRTAPNIFKQSSLLPPVSGFRLSTASISRSQSPCTPRSQNSTTSG